MDPNKERLAFYRLIDSTCRAQLPQYFLITPKLLDGLEYTADCTLLFVFNGLFSLRQKEWNLEEFIRRRKQLADEQDSPP